jgi:hypothetical protein
MGTEVLIDVGKVEEAKGTEDEVEVDVVEVEVVVVSTDWVLEE